MRSGIALGAISLLAACANQADITPSGNSLPVAQEAEHYQARAKSYYAPPGPANDPWGPYIHEASDRFDVPERWIRAVIERESGGRLFDSSGHFVTSVPGAMGLMQLMPPTYDDLRNQYNLNDDPYDPHDNILAGTAYIRQMYDIYGNPGFLAAYNDGPGSLDSYLRRGRALPRETRRYVASIGPKIAGYWPHNRSAADILVSHHDPNSHIAADDDSSPPPSAASQNVSSAWAKRDQQNEQSDTDDTPDTSTGSEGASTPSTPPTSTTPESPSDVSASWAARGIHSTPTAPPPAPHPAPTNKLSDDTISDNRITAQILPVGHRLQAQSIVAEVPASGLHYRLAPMPHTTAATAENTPGHWAIQVGAYASSAQALAAANKAHKTRGGTVQVTPIHTAHGLLYRARVTNLNHTTAENACQHLQAHTACVVVPPETF